MADSERMDISTSAASREPAAKVVAGKMTEHCAVSKEKSQEICRLEASRLGLCSTKLRKSASVQPWSSNGILVMKRMSRGL